MITREFLVWGFPKGTFLKTVQTHVGAYPGTRVRVETAPAYSRHRERLRRELQADWTSLGLLPVHYCDLPDLVRRGWLKPLNSLLPARARAVFAPLALDLTTFGGRVFAIPEDITLDVLVARREDLRRHRLPFPGQLSALEKQLDFWDGRRDAPVMGIQNVMRFLLGLLGARGVHPGEALENVSDFQTDWIAAYNKVRALIGGPRPRIRLEKKCHESLRKGRLTYCIVRANKIGRWTVAEQRAVRVLPFPCWTGSSTVPLLHGRAWCIPHNTIAPDIAFGLLHTLLDGKVARRIERDGGYAFPARQALWRDPGIVARNPIYEESRELFNKQGPAYSLDRINARALMVEETFLKSLEGGQSGASWFEHVQSGDLARCRWTVKNRIVRLALDYIEDHLPELRSIDQVAAAARRNPQYLNRCFKAETGRGCWSYVQERRMIKAREMLSDMTLSQKEIAAKLGFGSISYFSQAFKRHWGCSPTRMRGQEPSEVLTLREKLAVTTKRRNP